MTHRLFLDLTVQALEVKTKDVVFKVYREGKKYGELRVSQGAVVWRGRKDKDGRKLGWERFDRLFQEAGRRAERRKPGAVISVPRRKRRG